MIRSFQHYGLAVPDPGVGLKFYSDFGLEGRVEGNRAVLRCAGRDQDQIVLVEGTKKRFHHVSFGTGADEIGAIQRRIEAAGVKLVDPPFVGAPDGLWLRDLDGHLVNIRVADAAPIRTERWEINAPGHHPRVNARGCPPRGMRVRPRRLGHMILFTPQVEKQTAFYTNVLGMRLSDKVEGGIIAFMRCAGDSDHHVLALLKSDRPGFHHASFEVGSVDEIAMGAAAMLDKGYGHGWGLGRHVIGSNFYHYIRDPWNSLVEMFCDIDWIAADQPWEPREWGPEDSLYMWSVDGPAPESFGANYEER